jgi:choline dehydrogenase-like flavoprotein
VVERHAREAILAKWPGRCLTIGRTANLTEAKPDEGRTACQNRSICARGCSYGAYFSTQSSTLPAAMKTGRLTVLTDAVVEGLDYNPATRRVTGVRYIETATKQRGKATARLVFLNAGAFNSVHLLLNSASVAMPHGLANSSGVLGTHIMDHANTLSAMALMPGFEGHTTFGNRPTGVIIPRYRNMDTMDGTGHTRGSRAAPCKAPGPRASARPGSAPPTRTRCAIRACGRWCWSPSPIACRARPTG